MLNPLLEARRSHGLTQDQLATFAQVTRQVVVHAEVGLYIQPPTAVVRALEISNYVAFNKAYREWVRNTRAHNSVRFDRAVKYFKTWHGCPFSEFRSFVGTGTQFAIARELVFPLSLVVKFEANGACADSMQIAFDECGLDIRVEDFGDDD